jgi:HD-like signal output (HDOD) protein
MFAWLINMFRGHPSDPPPPSAHREVTDSRVQPLPRPKQGPSYIDLLRAQATVPGPLTHDEEAQVVALVQKVITYVVDNKLDPPTMPALAPRVLDTLRDPKLDVARLARTLEQDQAISAKVLTIANSALFAPNKEVSSLRDAITMLGIDQVAQISIGLATRSLFDATAKAELAVDRSRWHRLFIHGMVTAFATANLYAEHRKHTSDEAFLSGLFHDVGKAVALRAIAAMTVAGEWPAGVSTEMLDEVLHRVHAGADGAFYERWAFPSQLMAVCAQHHRLEECGEASEILHWVSVVSSLHALRSGSPVAQREALEELPIASARLGLSDAQLRSANTQVKDFTDRVTRLFPG